MTSISYNPDEIIESIKKKKIPRYPHFDAPVGVKKFASKLKNPDYIASHPFWPLIYFNKNFTKFHSKHGKKPKDRKLCYASYHDRLVYQYYAEITNRYYNEYVIQNNIEDSPIAYRTNLGQSNIDFAKKAFDYIREANETYIIVGDFKSFFDSLDHKYLKQMLCQLFNVKQLPQDWYKVFKSITQYSECEEKIIFNYLKRKDPTLTCTQFKKLPRVFNIQEFKEFKKSVTFIDGKETSPIVKHQETYGIPQGTPISAVWANVYMLNFDKNIRNLINLVNGYYMRYSDDFIIILPNCTQEVFKQVYESLSAHIDATPGLKIESNKTGLHLYTGNTIKRVIYTNGQITLSHELDIVDYLGFTFNGTDINLRPKTISKYHYRTRRKAKTVAIKQKLKGRQIKTELNKLYALYAISPNTTKEKHQNFHSYFRRTQKKFNIMGPLSRPRSKILRVAVSRIILSSEASKVKLVGNLVA